jgi:hypothetical protein
MITKSDVARIVAGFTAIWMALILGFLWVTGQDIPTELWIVLAAAWSSIGLDLGINRNRG